MPHRATSARSIARVVRRIGDELLSRLEREFPPASEPGNALDWPPNLQSDGEDVRLTGAGCYLRIVDYEGLVALATRTDRRFTTLVAPGAFCVPDTPIALVHGGRLNDACLRELRGHFCWGGDRTPDQDVLFLVDQLAEVAGKVL